VADETSTPQEGERGSLVAFPLARSTNNRPPDNLPLELSSFVGREREISEVKRSLENGRLSTLTGAGGCGKTRLALAVAQEMVEEYLVWTLSMAAPPFLRVMNAVSGLLPLWSWRPAPLLRMRQWVARRLLGMGDIRLSFGMPSGHEATIMPERIFFVEASKAVLDGEDLGAPVRLAENPTIGGIPLPARPTFAIGQAHMRIRDHEEYLQTRNNTRSQVREHPDREQRSPWAG
jgi:energy-coupling factor transporter ATP-binding protein EcfA2